VTEREIYGVFVDCMAAFVHGNTLDLPHDMALEDQKALYKLAKRQSLSGALHAVTAPYELTPPLKERLRRDGFVILSTYEQQEIIIADIKAAFAKNGIEHLFFKGAVVRQYYKTPAMRSMGDVDVLIRETMRGKADEIMRGMGFECLPESTEVWVYRKDGCFVEVHTAVRRFDVNRQETVVYDTVWHDAVPTDGTTYRLTDEAEAAHTVTHLASHFCGGGCGLRQLMDVAVWCDKTHDDAFWDRVTALLEPYGMKAFVARLLGLCKAWFDVDVPSCAQALDDGMQDAVRCRLLADGTFGNDERALLSRMRKARHKQQGKGGTVLRWIFPSPSYLKRQYAYAAKHAWLIPVAYGHRLFDGVTKNRRTHKKRMKYAKEHEARLQEELDFFEKLGL